MNISTKNQNTWCPGCTNFQLLESVKIAISNMIKKGAKKEEFAMSTGIGCHAKIFDYLDISGLYGLHGRAIPAALGMKLGNPGLKVLAFAGDGDTYSEGMEHFMHAFRHNPDITLIVHDNRDFSLTGGQPSSTTQQGYRSKVQPFGEMDEPFNPIIMALAAGAGFVARCNARDVDHTAGIIEKAVNYKGFAFIEVIQDCMIFNTGMNNLDERMYKVSNRDINKAWQLAGEWDYNGNSVKSFQCAKNSLGIFQHNSKDSRIPIGIIFSKEKKTLEEKQKIL